jgi:hypothetical protein
LFLDDTWIYHSEVWTCANPTKDSSRKCQIPSPQYIAIEITRS